ncbi:MAG TPA: TPM domain-containing protein [Usitatibacter sp.]|nr:TPM domain-containing protein [Usitatibacter sp.]
MSVAIRAAAAVAALLLALAAFAEIAVPKLTGRVIDQTGSLTAAERDALEEKLRAFEAAKGSQVAVLLVPTIEGEAIEDFAGRVTDAWKLGRKGVDDGVLFVVAKQERKMRIHTGRGVQGTLTDALARRIIADLVAPRFRTGDFAGGVDAGVDAVMKAIEGEQLPLPASKSASRKVDTVSSYSNFLWIAFFAVPVVAMVLRGLVGRFMGAGLTSGITGFAAWLVFGSLAFGLVAAVVAFLFTLGGGSGLTRGAGRRGNWGGVFIPGGGSWGGGGGFGGGGGGFSGGGGGFDGGGSSGSW